MFVSRSSIALWLIFYLAGFAWSIPAYTIGLTGSLSIAMILFVSLLTGFFVSVPSIAYWVVTLAITIWLTLLAKWGWWAIYWSPLYLLTAYFLIINLQTNDFVILIRFLTHLVVALIFGSYIAIAYKILGLPPLAQVPFGSRYLDFYPLSLSYQYMGYIRPSGIYDEPGALSFMICTLAYLRYRMGFNLRNTIVLLLLGNATLSLAHTFFSILFLLTISLHVSHKKFLTGLFSLAFLLLIAIAAKDYLPNVFLSRFEFSDGRLAGDNRSSLMESAYNLISYRDLWLYGLGPISQAEIELLSEADGPFSTNPLSPIVFSGIIGSFWYYFFLIFLFLHAASKPARLPMLAIFVLFLQRPYIMNFGYSMLFLLILRAELESVGLFFGRKFSRQQLHLKRRIRILSSRK
jgi:hypothetical protein